jgi:hypothetical protein
VTLPAQPKPFHVADIDRLPSIVGCHSTAMYAAAVDALPVNGHRPAVEIRPERYYRSV